MAGNLVDVTLQSAEVKKLTGGSYLYCMHIFKLMNFQSYRFENTAETANPNVGE